MPFNPTKTISQLIESQAPAFVREDYPTFIAFLKAYYEWLETNGAEVYRNQIVASDAITATLSPDASSSPSAYKGMSLVVLNGPAKGYTRKIVDYDPIAKVVTIETAWLSTNVPPPNTMVAIRDAFYPDQLLTYRDIDSTLDNFLSYFQHEFLYQVPGTLLADQRHVLKNIKQFYQARGTEDSFRFLFRILFGQEIEFYYPKVDIFKLSDARWSTTQIIRTTTTTDTFDFVNRLIIGVSSGATAKVESATQSYIAGHTVTDFTLSSIDGGFTNDPVTQLPEQIKIVYPTVVIPQSDLGALSDLIPPSTVTKWENIYQILTTLAVETPGENYSIGDPITISSGDELVSAKAVVTAVFDQYYNGRATPAPQSYYLQPFWGPNDTINSSGNPLQDNVCIPGLYFYSDVHSTNGTEIITSNQIILSSTETSVDEFFVGDELAITSGTGSGQRKTVVSYNGATRVATVDSAFNPTPDGTSQYSIHHVKGGIKAVRVTDFGLGFLSNPTVTITSPGGGTGASIPPTLGCVGTTAGQWLLGRNGGVGDAPTTTDSFLDSNKVIQDSFYWQDFSYDLRVGETINKYREVVKSLLHPAGMQMFGTVLLQSQPATTFFQNLNYVILQFDPKVFDTTVTVQPTVTLAIDTQTSNVLGTTNQDFDAFKFNAFAPNSLAVQGYSYPNQNYWSGGATGNTQIGQFAGIEIGTIILNPNVRTNVNPDSYITIDNNNSVPQVGPIGQSWATVAQFRFTGFPPFQTFDEQYPAPNVSYWESSYGNTTISAFANAVLADVIVSPDTIFSNICVDSDIAIYSGDAIPVIGDICEYAFMEGPIDQILYNVSPNAHGEFDAVLGDTQLAGGNDPTWVSSGLSFASSSSELVNATGIPLNLSQMTVVVVAKPASLTANMGLISSIPDGTTNGYAIDILENGGVAFRFQYDGVTKNLVYPTGTLSVDTYFLVAMTFDQGLLSGRVNQSRTLSVRYGGTYPAAPTTTSVGWYLGRSSVDYATAAQPPALFGATKFGTVSFEQQQQSGASTPVGFFDGVMAYAVFYDRPLFDFELDSIYNALKTKLLNERSIVLP